MAYFPDLSPYAYGHNAHPGVVHVGWLDNVHHFTHGTVETRLIEKMTLLAAKPVELCFGSHVCELCVEPPDLVKAKLTNEKLMWEWAKQLAVNVEPPSFERASHASIVVLLGVLRVSKNTIAILPESFTAIHGHA